MSRVISRWRSRRDLAIIPTIVILFWVSVAVVAFAALAIGIKLYAQASAPNLSHDAAERVAHNVVTEVRAATLYDATAQARIAAASPKTWTQNVVFSGATVVANITASTNAGLLVVDVRVGSATAREFSALSATAVAPGSKI